MARDERQEFRDYFRRKREELISLESSLRPYVKDTREATYEFAVSIMRRSCLELISVWDFIESVAVALIDIREAHDEVVHYLDVSVSKSGNEDLKKEFEEFKELKPVLEYLRDAIDRAKKREQKGEEILGKWVA